MNYLTCNEISLLFFVRKIEFKEENYDELYSAMQEFDKLMSDNGLNITAEDIWSDYVEGV